MAGSELSLKKICLKDLKFWKYKKIGEVGDADCHLAIDINKMLQKVPLLPTECCIYKVPVNLRSENEAAYTPKVVSIGPLHHGEEKLKPMEAQKERYLIAFLGRNPDITLEDCVRRSRGLEKRARENYYEHQFSHSFSSDEFVTMMLLDGCFIVELFLFGLKKPAERNDYDQIFNGQSIYKSVISDLLLLENQLPFFLLKELFDFINGPNKQRFGYSFFDLTVANLSTVVKVDIALHFLESGYKVEHFVDYMLHCYKPLKTHEKSSRVKHFVDYILNCYPGSQVIQTTPIDERKNLLLPSATELQESGIKFKKSRGDWLLDMKYKKGVLEIPTLLVDDSTEYIFRNLIAMEQCRPGRTFFITDYTTLMDFLINDPKDVALLRSHGIIENYLGSDEAVCQLFNGLGNGVFADITKCHYNGLLKDVNYFYNTKWNRWKAKLRRDYFSNPWTIISLKAAILLLICTFIQAVYSVISYMK